MEYNMEEMTNTEERDHKVNGAEYTEADPLKPKSVQSQKKATASEKCCHILRNVTVEPIMLLFVMACILSMQTTQNLNLDKACRVNLNFSTHICDSLRLQNTENMSNYYEAAAQKLAASAMSWRSIITATVPCLIALFVGSWTDATGHRKIFITVPIIGQILVCINNMINVFFFYQLPLEVLVFTEAFIEGFSGSWCITFLSIFSFISSITTNEERTFRLGIANFSLTVGFPIGMGISGVMLRHTGYYGCYGLAASLHVITLLYNIFVLKDPPRTNEQKKHDGLGAGHFFRTFFNLTNVRHTLSIVFGGARSRRVRMCVLLVAVSILFGPLYGEMSILYLSTRYRFKWDEVMFSIFQTYNFVAHTIGTLFSITVFSKYLQWHDSILGIISTVSKIAASFVYCFAPNERIFFLAPLVDILNGTSLLAMRSITSKIVAPEELGKVNSIFSLVENLMPLVYVPIYTRIYRATLDTLPGAVFLVGAGMTLPVVAIFIWLFVEHRKNLRKSKQNNKDVTE